MLNKNHYTSEYFTKRDLLDEHLAYTISLLLKKHSFKKVVDIGCGTGKLVKYLAEQGFKSYGCEPSRPALVLARKINKPNTIFKSIASRLPFLNRSMDMVCAISVIEHLTTEEMDLFLKETKRILKQNGVLFLVTPNYSSVWRTIQGKRWFGYSDPTHIRFFRPGSLSRLLGKNGFGFFDYQFKTLYDPPYAWELPGVLGKLPKIGKQILTYLLISTPLWRVRNSFWTCAQSLPTTPNCLECNAQTRTVTQVKLPNQTHYFYNECTRCKLITICPMPTKISQNLYSFSDSLTHGARVNPQLNALSNIPGGKELLKLYTWWCNFFRFQLISRIKSSGNLLDVGCGEGAFLKFFHKANWKISGIEINPQVAKIAHKVSKAQIYTQPAEKVKLRPSFFDVVTLWHVLEHFINPKVALKKITNSIKPGGFLIIEVPQGQAMYRKIFGPSWQLLIPGQHLYFWSQQSLTNLLQSLGYRIVKVSYLGIVSFSGASSIANWLRTKNISSRISIAVSFALFPLMVLINILQGNQRENLLVIAQKNKGVHICLNENSE